MIIKNYIKQISKFEFFPIIFILVLIVCNAAGMLSYYKSSEVLKDNIIETMMLRSEDNASLLSQQINEFKIIIEGVAFRTKVKSMDWEIQKPALIAEAKRLNIKRFQVVNLNGLARSTTGITLDLSKRKWVKKALQGETYISEPFSGSIDNKIIFVCATPIRNEESEIAGALGAAIDPQFLYNIIKNITVGKTGYGFIISKDGNMIAHPNQNFILSEDNANKEKKEFPYLAAVTSKIIKGKKGFISYEFEGVEKCATYTPIPNTNWILALSAPKKEIFNEVNDLKNNFLLITLITIAICIFSFVLFISHILEKKKIVNLEKRVEEDKKLLRESAELEKIRTQFFANISHEFRTPLNVILSSLQLFKLYYEKENALQTVNLNKHLKSMKQNCYRLLRLVNNLIDTTRIDVGFLETHMQNHNIVNIVEDITMSIVEFTEMKGIKLLFDTDVEEKIIACDVDKIERIILNLISNAIKFTNSNDSIFVNVSDKGQSIVISVKDTGIGIPEDKQEIIFERFMQVDETLIRNHEGSGIGLSMAKSFVEMQGGTLTVVSEYGKGSEFIVELPAVILKSEENTDRYVEVESQQRIERINIEFSDIYFS